MSEATKRQDKPVKSAVGVDISELLNERLKNVHSYLEPVSTLAIHQTILGCLIAVAKQRLRLEGIEAHDELAIAMIRSDIVERSEMGLKKYGDTLHSFNGRDASLDLYQELHDAYVYSGQQLEEERCSTSHSR